MFDIYSIAIENFKSYAGKHRFNLPTQAGLYFLTGENRVEPRLESNGAGKSTLLDAVYWCLYGKTLRGLRGGDVVTWEAESCTVELDLCIGDDAITVTRSQNPNKLLIDDRPVDQETLQKQIRLGDDAFLYSVIMPQIGQSFFELTPTAKLSLFSQIMGLDYWLERSTAAAERADRLKGELNTLSTKIANQHEWLKRGAIEIADLVQKEADFEKAQQQTIHFLNKDLGDLDLKVLELADSRKEINEALKVSGSELNLKMQSMESIEAALSKHLERRTTLNDQLVEDTTKYKMLQDDQSTMQGLAGTCPTCLQGINSKILSRRKQVLSAALDAQEGICAGISNQMDETSKFIAKVKKDLLLVTNIVAALNRERNQDQKNLMLLEHEIETYRSLVSATKLRISTEQKRTNPYSAMIDTKHNDSVLAEALLKSGEIKLGQLNIEHASVFFWVAGFKRLRLFLIEDTLRALELEVNGSLATLGLEDWQVAFDVERENKSGGVTKGFVVFIRNASYPKPVRFEAWSGGEAQRLQLAGDLGLANLIMLQAGLRSTVEFYDEPSKHLSRAGLLDLAETLHQRAVNDGKRLFLIDHHTVEFGDFAATIKVIKTEKGSTLEYAA